MLYDTDNIYHFDDIIKQVARFLSGNLSRLGRPSEFDEKWAAREKFSSWELRYHLKTSMVYEWGL